MKRTTIALPDELRDALDDYVRRQETPPPVTEVIQAALRQYLERQQRFDDQEFRPFRITPAERGSGFSDISVNHDVYLAEDTYNEHSSNL